MSFIRKLFLITEGLLYLVFTCLSLYETKFSRYENILKYISIILCFLYAVFSWYSNNISFRNSKEWTEIKKDGIMVILGLGGTLAADWCLLLKNYHRLGVFIFLFVQIIYLYRLSGFVKIRHYIRIFLFAGGLMVLKAAAIELDPLLILSLCYGILILENGLRGLLYLFQRDKSNKTVQKSLFSLGLFLFLLCDINVAIFNMERYLSLDSPVFKEVYSLASVGMWVFYLPSQVLISSSVFVKNVKV